MPTSAAPTAAQWRRGHGARRERRSRARGPHQPDHVHFPARAVGRRARQVLGVACRGAARGGVTPKKSTWEVGVATLATGLVITKSTP